MKTLLNHITESIALFCRQQWYCILIFSFIILTTGASWLVSMEAYYNNPEPFIIHHEAGVQYTSGMAESSGIMPWNIGILPTGDALVTGPEGQVRMISNYFHKPMNDNESATVIHTGLPSGAGLLGIAIHPDFLRTRLFYLCLNLHEDGNIVNRIELWRLSEDGIRAIRKSIITSEIIIPDTQPEIFQTSEEVQYFVGTSEKGSGKLFSTNLERKDV
jgi:hypothetical protein